MAFPESKNLRRYLQGPVFICSFFLILYFLTASPSLGWRDGPEFTSATHSLGIPHPAGFPTFSLLTKIMTYLPFGSIPFRITLGVGLFAAGSLWLLYNLILRWSLVDVSADKNAVYGPWMAAGTAVAFGLTSTLWGNTTENEVYSLNLLFIALILYCTIKWSLGDGERWLFSGALLYGLAAGNHGSVALYSPGFLAFFLIRAGSHRWRNFFLVLFFFLVGFSVYLYLPIRSVANPLIDFGNPENWQRFFMHVSDRKDSQTHFVAIRDGANFLDTLLSFSRNAAPWWFWPFVLPLVLVGLWRTTKADKALAGMIIYICLINILFFIRWAKVHSNFLPLYFLSAYLAGIGSTWILYTSRFLYNAPRLRTSVLSTLLACMFIGSSVLGYRIHNRSRNYLSFEIFRPSYETLPPESITIVTTLWPYHLAFQDVYRMRDDLTTLLQSDFLAPDFFSPITPDRFPLIKVPETVDDHGQKTIRFQNFIDENVKDNRGIFFEPMDHTTILLKNLAPGPSFLMQFTPEPFEGLSRDFVQRIFDQIRDDLLEDIQTRQLFDESEVSSYYFRYLYYLGQYLRQNYRITDSINVYKMIVELFGPHGLASVPPNDIAAVYIEWATILSSLGDHGAAIDRLELALELLPNDPSILYNMGQFLYRQGEMKRAEEFLQRSLAIQETDLALFFLGRVYEFDGQSEVAILYYQKAKNITINEDLRDRIEDKLKTTRSPSTQ